MSDNVKTLSEFAAHIDRAPSYVTALKKAGRLVLNARGRVLVRESIELIEQTAGTRSDVARRNQEKRQATGENSPSKSQPGKGEGKASGKSDLAAEYDSQKEALKQANIDKAMAESRRVQALADKEEMERDRLAGELIAREEVDAAMKFIGASIRALLDVLPDQVAPVIAPITNFDEVHAQLTEHCRNVLVELGQAIERQQAEIQRGRV